jgi:hypothetical protein
MAVAINNARLIIDFLPDEAECGGVTPTGRALPSAELQSKA